MKIIFAFLIMFVVLEISAVKFSGKQSIQNTLTALEKQVLKHEKMITELKHTTALHEETIHRLTTEEKETQRFGLEEFQQMHPDRGHNVSLKPTPEVRANIMTSYGCVGDEVNMTCPDDKTLLLERADYGEYYLATSGCTYPHPLDCTEEMEDTDADEWALLKFKCDGQTFCSYLFQGSIFMYDCTMGAPVTYVSIYYSCLPDDSGDTVAFTVYPTEPRNYTVENMVVIFDGALTNDGDHFDLSVDRFYCPQDGLYFFSLTIFTPRSQIMVARIMRNDNTLTTAYADNIEGVYSTATTSVIEHCYFGQTIWVRSMTANSQLQGSSAHYTAFSGYLLEQV